MNHITTTEWVLISGLAIVAPVPEAWFKVMFFVICIVIVALTGGG